MPGGAPKGNHNHLIHGGRKTRLYYIWKTMRQRCNNPKSQKHKSYHDRGITICHEWDDFAVFREWAYSSGYRDDLTIDRIDNDGNYCPENCRWATLTEQARNKQNTLRYEYQGKSLCISEIAEACGVPYKRVHALIRYRGKTPEEVFAMFGKTYP